MRELEEANRTLSKRRRAKKSRIRAGGPLTIHAATDILDSKDVQEQLEEETRTRAGGANRTAVGVRRCGECGKTRHNSRTCQGGVKVDGECESEYFN